MFKLQQVQDDILSLTDLVRFARTDLNLTISRQTVSRILRNFDMMSYIAPKKPRITSGQRRTRVDDSYEHLNWSINDLSKNESNYEILNRKNRIYKYVVFDTAQLDLNVHNNMHIGEGD